ncbi:MAG: SBBP repeat-containing protein, partial [Bacteroidota bacterium]
MSKYSFFPWIISLVFLLGLAAWSQPINKYTTPFSGAAQPARETALSNAKAPWVKNAGQWDADIAFVAATFSGNTIINKDKEIIYALPVDSTSGYVLKERFVGKIKDPARQPMVGELVTASVFNYFLGNDPARWQSRVPSYQLLNMGEIWEGIELKLNAHDNNVEKLFYVQPGIRPQTIAIEMEGAEGLSVANDGRLLVQTPADNIAYSAPVAYQWIGGVKHLAKAKYKIDETYSNAYTFEVSDYDPKYELIIDPLLASTFIGDGGNDWANAIVVDDNGNVFTTGYAWSDNFPTTAGSFSESFNGVKDAFISKLSNDLSELLVSTYLGGSSWDNGLAIAVEEGGNIIVSGATGSANFPIAGTAYDNAYNGGSNDVFVCKLDNELSTMIVSTFIGGDGDDYGYALTLDETGNVFVTGRTESANYPAMGGFDLTFNGGFEDVFISKLNNGLSALLASTYVGGNSDEGADAIVVRIVRRADRWKIVGISKARNEDIPGRVDHNSVGA